MSRMSSTPPPVDVSSEVQPEYGDGQREGPGILQQIHQMLRGRYHWAIILPLLLGSAGAFAGWKLAKPEYTSTGVIRIKPVLPRVLYQNEGTGAMPMFDAFIASQLALIRSPRLVNMAMEDPRWKELGRGSSPEQTQKFHESLVADTPKRSELILVNFTDPDPAAAQRAVRSLVVAYQNLYSESDSESGEVRLQLLDNRRSVLESEYKSANNRILSIAAEVGTSSLDKTLDFKLGELNELESKLRDIQVAIAVASGGPDADGSATTEPAPVAVELSEDQLAVNSPALREALADRRALSRQIAMNRVRLGENHRQVQDDQALLALMNQKIAELKSEASQAAPGDGAFAAGLAGKSLDRLKLEEANVRTLYEKSREDMLALGRRSVEMETIRIEMAETKAKLDETNQRIEALRLEGKVGGRLEVISDGDLPLSPSANKRVQFAALGGLSAAGLGLGSVLLRGLMDRRVLGITDVEKGVRHSARILGVLPSLPEDLSDPEQAMLAAHGVHQIRTMMMARLNGINRPTVAITSPSPGAGKTSLTLALGMSLAGSGSKTLLIDCDLVGGGLTHRMKKITRRRLGHILRREGLVTTQQLGEALRLARSRRRLIGETLVELGYITPADVDHALTVQHETLVGLQEALDGEPADECITGTGTPGLYMMPLGSASQQHAGRLSHAALQKLLDQVRNWFDVVLIDTGPILGSLEAPMVAMATDASVMVVACGEQRPLVERATDMLLGTGAPFLGVVVNRADTVEMMRSSFAPSVDRMSVRQLSIPRPDGKPLPSNRHLVLGPIGDAVASNTYSDGVDKTEIKPE